MDADAVCPRPLLQRDAHALIGVLAILEGHAMASHLDAALLDHLSRRLASLGLLANGTDDREFRQALNDMNHRLRYALSDNEEAQGPIPDP